MPIDWIEPFDPEDELATRTRLRIVLLMFMAVFAIFTALLIIQAY